MAVYSQRFLVPNFTSAAAMTHHLQEEANIQSAQPKFIYLAIP
jgi:hypothetical protein